MSFVIFILFLGLSFCGYSQDQVNVRTIRHTRGDTLVIAGILTDAGIDKPYRDLLYYWYSGNGIFFNQGGYSGNLLHGNYAEYDSEGKMLLKGAFTYGLKTGKWQKWYYNGFIMKVEHWKKGKKHGPFLTFNESGITVEEIRYKNNKEVKERKIHLFPKADEQKID